VVTVFAFQQEACQGPSRGNEAVGRERLLIFQQVAGSAADKSTGKRLVGEIGAATRMIAARSIA
jgi:hypothetical protein